MLSTLTSKGQVTIPQALRQQKRLLRHWQTVPLAQAVQLAPGDVLPIEAPRDVQLRIGTHHIARGTIAPLGDEGALLVTIISRRPDPATLASLGEPS